MPVTPAPTRVKLILPSEVAAYRWLVPNTERLVRRSPAARVKVPYGAQLSVGGDVLYTPPVSTAAYRPLSCGSYASETTRPTGRPLEPPRKSTHGAGGSAATPVER